jgi:quercetin dioxygenase-like cupin family protein
MIEHHFSAGVYAKEVCIPAGQVLVQHKHKFDHLSILASGLIELMVGDKRTTIDAPACLTIKANEHHGVKAITDVVWYCIHATDCTDIDQIDDLLIVASDDVRANELAKCLQE